MDALFIIGQIAAIAGLGYGAWLCFVHAGIYDADSARADEAASRGAQVRGHVEPIYSVQDLPA